MVKDLNRYSSGLTMTLAVAAVLAGCSGDSDSLNNGSCLPQDPCDSCVPDGECCEVSANCAPGRICNRPVSEFFDETQPLTVCIQVTCDSTADCEDGEVCGRDKQCRVPICQVNGECTGGQICIDGACQAAPTSAQVASCAVVTPDVTLSTGGTASLTAVASDVNGAPLIGISFDWTSSDANVVSVSGRVATAEAAGGTARITASPAGSAVACEGDVAITNVSSVSAGSTRVVVAQDGVGVPVGDASVTVTTAAGAQTAMTAANGAVTFQLLPGEVTSVTVEKEGFKLFTVIEPGVDDVFIPLPATVTTTSAGGFRGSLDLSQVSAGEVKFAFVGPGIPTNVLDFGGEELLGDIFPTEIEVPLPDLTIDEPVPLSGGVILALGTDDSTQFTEVPERCIGATPGIESLGCYVTRAPPGLTAGWAIGGQIPLLELTPLVAELTPILTGADISEVPLAEILPDILPFLTRFNHGLEARLNIESFPKVRADGSNGSCADPTIPNFDEVCIADFSQYQPQDLTLTQGFDILASVGVPSLPVATSGNCSSGAIMAIGANLEGRGLIPLGVSAGLAKGPTDCQVAGVAAPFGTTLDRVSEDIPDGRMPLSMATPHSGLEGSQLLVVLIALDIDGLIASSGAGFQVAAIINRVDRIDTDQTNVTGTFLPYPEGTVNKATAQVNFTSSLVGTTVTRAEISRGDQSWLVYAPAAANIDLSGIQAGQSIISNATGAVILTVDMQDGVSYSDVWRVASGRTLDRLFDNVDGFVVSDCPENDATAACQLQ